MKKAFAWLCLLICWISTQRLTAQDRSVVFSSSNLPIVLIDPHGQTIWDSPQIIADMGVIDNGPGMRNDTADVFNDYSGKIAIEIRGSSSQMFPKKQYAVELRDATGSVDNSSSLLGLPEEEDWILFAPYNDKSLMRDVLAYKLGRDLGRYAPRTRYCEVFIKKHDPHLNKVHYYYQGIYVLIEKIKRDDNRVAIAKLNPDEITGDDVTGGYILKIDKTTGSSGPGWNSPHLPPNTHDGQQTYYQFEVPDWDEIVAAQKKYIREYVTRFEDALAGTYFRDPVNGYAKYIDMDSFVDFMIMQEITRNVDGYRLSTFLHKQKDSDGGKLVMGPIWDFNLGFGNANYCSGWKTNGFMFREFNAECADHISVVPFWWERFMKDKTFTNKLALRWETLRAGKFSVASINDDIDSIYTLLNHEAAARNFQAWDVMGEYVWPNQVYQGQTYPSEVQYLKTWISNRMAWLDANMPKYSPVTNTDEPIADFNISFYPNPVASGIQIEYEMLKPGDINIEILDVAGKTVQTFSKTHSQTGKYLETIDGSNIAPGILFARVQLNDGKPVIHKLVKKSR
jgi:hypothetical protein